MLTGKHRVYKEKYISPTTCTHNIKSFLKHKQRSRETNDKDRLCGEDTEDDSLDTGGDQKLRHAHHLLRFVS